MKASRLRPSNAAKVEANLGSDHLSREGQEGKLERRELSRLLGYRARRRSHSMLGLRREDWASSQVLSRANQGKFRHRGATENLNVNDSVHLRLRAQVNTNSVAQEVRRLEVINRSTRPEVPDPRVKRAAKENVARARTASRSSSNRVARLLEPSTGNSRKVERGNLKKERRRHGHNNFVAITPVAPE